MPTAGPRIGQAIAVLVAQRGIGFHPGHQPKAGVFAHAHADIVASRIADELSGHAPTDTFNGHGACFLETGDGRAAYATGNFYHPEGPALRLQPPARRWHLAKTALERYWLTRWWW